MSSLILDSVQKCTDENNDLYTAASRYDRLMALRRFSMENST
jgi:hypothetical protein